MVQQPKGFNEYQRAEEEFQIKKAFALQDALLKKQTLDLQRQKANELDIGKMGEQAFIKAAQGMPLDSNETAALQYLDAKSPTAAFNPVTGVMEQKPSFLERANIGVVKQPLPTQKMTRDDANKIIDVFGGDSAPAPQPTPEDNYNSAMNDELKKAAGNPKLQQTIREKYVTTPEQIFTRENTLRDEFGNLTKNYRTIKSAYDKIQNTSDNAAGDLSLLYQYNKLLDPESVVRESEFATVASSGSLGQRLQGAMQKLATGERLTPEQRAQFKAEAENILGSQGESYKSTKTQYEDISKRNRVNPANVIPDYGNEPAQLVVPQVPPNAKLYGTSGGKDVYKLPDGKFVMEQ